jgi:hypothetical protein
VPAAAPAISAVLLINSRRKMALIAFGLHLAAGGGDPPSYRDREGVYLEKIAILELLCGLAP